MTLDIPSHHGWKARRANAQARQYKREAARADDEVRAAHIRQLDRLERAKRAQDRQDAADATVREIEAQIAALERRAMDDPRLIALVPPVAAKLDVARAIADRTAALVKAELATLDEAAAADGVSK